MFDRGPRFSILGGIVFQELTKPYLRAWGDKWRSQAPFKLIHTNAYPEIYEEEGHLKLDETDRKILRLLQSVPEISTAAVGEEIGASQAETEGISRSWMR